MHEYYLSEERYSIKKKKYAAEAANILGHECTNNILHIYRVAPNIKPKKYASKAANFF